ncbi:MAG: TraR/DksA family transcriptional regulator [Candidatus Sulfotelmatobacter sp.]
MTKTEIEQFRRKLESNRADALRFLARLASEARSLDADIPQDSGDYSVATLSKESLIQQSSERRRLVRTIDDALQRIRQGTFGVCAGCGDEIHSKRLTALPWTEYCIDCQEMLKQGEQLNGFAETHRSLAPRARAG